MNGLHILQLYSDSDSEWNVSQWRSLSPANVINAAHERGETPHTVKLFYMPTAVDWSRPDVQKQIGMGDIIVWQRNVIVPEVWAALDYWSALGKVNVVDLDDHYPCIPPSNPAFNAWIRNTNGLKPDPVTALEEGLRHADALTSPSKVILHDWQGVVRGYHLPNYCARDWYAGLDQRPTPAAVDVAFRYDDDGRELKAESRSDSAGWIVIGWGGSISHVDSWLYSGVIEALDRIFIQYPNVRLKFCGFEDRLNSIFDHWGDRVIRQLGVRPEHWPIVVSSFDIGLAPLDTRPLDPPFKPGAPVASYDERRSWLKAIEYLCAGVPWVGSRSLTYDDLARHGQVVENTPNAWYAALDNLIRNLGAAKREAWHTRQWALRALTLEGNLPSYLSVYERIYTERVVRRGARPPGIRYIEARQEAATA